MRAHLENGVVWCLFVALVSWMAAPLGCAQGTASAGENDADDDDDDDDNNDDNDNDDDNNDDDNDDNDDNDNDDNTDSGDDDDTDGDDDDDTGDDDDDTGGDDDDDDDTADGSYCYEEPVNPTADVSDIASAFNSGNWLESMLGSLERRYPSGHALITAQLEDEYLDDFVDTSSYEAMVESLMVVVHEENHMWDLGNASCVWDEILPQFVNSDWQPNVPIHGGFARKEILDLIEGTATSTTDSVYLTDQTQGEYKMQGVLAELDAQLSGMPAVAVLGEFINGYGASNARDLALTFMYYLELYLRKAEEAHADYYEQIKAEPLLKELVLIQWLKMHYFLEIAAPFEKLGTNDVEIKALVLKDYNVEALEKFTGHELLTEGKLNCLPEGDDWAPPF